MSTEERAATRLRLARLAEERFQSNRDAVEYLREVIDETPTHAEAGRELERLYTVERRWADLGELLERRADDSAAEGDAAGELAALVRIGELNERELKNLPRAVELYERVLERDPEHGGALAALARLAEADGQWERAVEMLNRALDQAPQGAASADAALHVAAILGQRLDDEAGMERALHRALGFDETSRGALEQIKALAQKRGDSLTLAAVMEREVPLLTDPKLKVAQYRALADIARDKLSDPGRAAAYMEQASELAPDDREILGALVDLYNESGRQRDAVPILERIIASYGTRREGPRPVAAPPRARLRGDGRHGGGAGPVRRGLQDRPDERADPARPRAPVPEDGRPRAGAEDLPRPPPPAPRRVGRHHEGRRVLLPRRDPLAAGRRPEGHRHARALPRK